MLEDEFRYYLEHQAELAAKHEGKVLVVKGQQVIGVYANEEEAIRETVREHELGSFLVQACSADPNSVVQTFRSRVMLARA